mgnify:CR=1 FL=1
MSLCHTRIKRLSDFMDLCSFFFIDTPEYTQELLCPKSLSPEESCYIIQSIIWLLDNQEDWSSQGIQKASFEVAEMFKLNHKKVIMKILFATITGRHQGPPLFDSFEILGKARARARLLKAMESLGGLSKNKLSALQQKFSNSLCHELINKS